MTAETAKPTCIEEGCNRTDISARGLCNRDYQRRSAAGTLPPLTPCPVPGCTNDWYYRGPCQSHREEFAAARMKWCARPGCNQPLKALSEFHKSNGQPDGLYAWCKPCSLVDKADYRTNNRGEIANRRGEKYAQLRLENPGHFHKLTAERYWQMWEGQGGQCAICSKDFDLGGGKATYPCIDHDHMHCPGGKKACPECVRGLLCNSCNRMLGNAHDDPAVLRRWKPTKAIPQRRIDSAIAYLEKWHGEMAKRGIRPPLEDALWQDLCAAMTSYVFAITPA